MNLKKLSTAFIITTYVSNSPSDFVLMNNPKNIFSVYISIINFCWNKVT